MITAQLTKLLDERPAQSTLRSKPGPRLIPPQHAHPLIRELYVLLDQNNADLQDVARRAGLGVNSITKWRTENTPSIANLEAVLNVIGKRLVIVDADQRSSGIDYEW
jgi:hypothetical protein